MADNNEWDNSADDEPDEDEDEDETAPLPLLDRAGEPYYYFDIHPTRDTLMGSTMAQSECRRLLMASIAGLCQSEDWLFVRLGLYRTRHVKEYPLQPDVMVIKGYKRKELNRSLCAWKLALPNKPEPEVVFEISQPQSWREDLYRKPNLYGRYGVKEYFAYDPHSQVCWDRPNQLYGWRYEQDETGEVRVIEMHPNDEGWLWSEELASWLVPDGIRLAFYDRHGQPRPVRSDWYLP